MPPKTPKLDDELKERLLDRNLVPEALRVGGKSYILHDPIAAGVSGAVWKCTDEHGRDRAVKLAVRNHYDARSYMEELARAGRLERYPQFARLYDAGIVEISFKDGVLKSFVAFIEEWVEGYTFRHLTAQEPELHHISLLRSFVVSFSAILAALEAENLRHDDLNANNILLVPPPKGDFERTWTVKVVDMASLKEAEKLSRKPRDDHRWFAEHLVALWNAVYQRRQILVRDRRFLAEAENIIRSMLDADPVIRLSDPDQIRAQFSAAFTRSQAIAGDEIKPFRDPFDYISAEHIWDDRLLVRLFARSCPWLDRVIGPDPCLLTGPRGCGKSTIFRWLSLKAQLLAHPDWRGEGFCSLPIIGFYISCSSDLQNRFAWVSSEALASRFQNEIFHYFNLLIVREILHTLALIAQRTDRDTYWGLGLEQERGIHAFIVDNFSGRERPRLQGLSLLEQAADLVEGEIYRSHSDIARRRNIAITTPPSLLGDFTGKLVDLLEPFRRQRIAFLVDDFSAHRLSAPVQVLLNRIIWDRRASHVFKLSSEKYGAPLDDSHYLSAELARELVEIDCGQEFIALDDSKRQAVALEFTKELLNNRLREANYEGNADSLIGPSRWEEKSLGRALRRKPEGRRNDQYHGLECIANLCSGDLSSLLLVYRRIFLEGGITSTNKVTVPKHVQHKAIRYVSQRMFDRIRTYHPSGPEMYEIVNHFGVLVRRILEEGRLISAGESEVPPQCPRIEIDQIAGAVIDDLNPSQREVARELIRRSIFIEMEPGLSRHGAVTSLRWQLRRIYLPAFNAALSKNDAIKRDPDWFKFFLSNPQEACEQEWKCRPKEIEGQGKLDFGKDAKGD